MSSKTEWCGPRLIVLARATPEETILSNCKSVVQSGSGTAVAGCRALTGASGKCTKNICNTIVTS